MVDARLPDGSRLNAVIKPLALDGALVSIRRFSAKPLTAEDLLARRTGHAPDTRVPGGMRPGSAEHSHFRWDWQRQDNAS